MSRCCCCSVVSNFLQPHGLQLARLPCSSLSPGVYSNSCPFWASDVIQPSHHQSSPSPPAFSFSQHSGSFPMSQFFASGGRSTGVSVSASVFPVNIQDWVPFGWTGLISLLSKWLSRISSFTTVQRHQFFSTQPFLLSHLPVNKLFTSKFSYV